MKKVLSLLITLSIIATMLVVPSVSVSASGSTSFTAAIESEGTLVFEEDYDHSTYLTSDANPDPSKEFSTITLPTGFTVGNAGKGETGYFASNPDDSTDGWLKLLNGESGAAEYRVVRTLSDNEKSFNGDYVVFSTKMKYNDETRLRLYLSGIVNGSSKTIAQLMVDNRSSYNVIRDLHNSKYYYEDGSTPGATNASKNAKASQYANRWIDVQYVVNNTTTAPDVTLYIDGKKYGTTTSKQTAKISGISEYRFMFDGSSQDVGKSIYLNDTKIYTLTPAQADAADLKALDISTIANGDTLPVALDYIIPGTVEWESSATNEVTIAENGTVTVADGFIGNVTLTATKGTATKQFVVTIEQGGDDEEEIVFEVPSSVKTGTVLPVTKGSKAVTWASPANEVEIAEDGTVTVAQSFYGDVTLTATIDGTPEEYTVKAGLAPVYVSITPGIEAHSVVGGADGIRFSGNNYSKPIQDYNINNPLYYDNTAQEWRSFVGQDDVEHNYLYQTGVNEKTQLEETKVAALTALFNSDGKGTLKYGRLRLDTGKAFNEDYKDIWVEVEFLDNFTVDPITIRYFGVGSTSTANKYVGVDSETGESIYGTVAEIKQQGEIGQNDGKWKTRRFHITDAYFDPNSSNQKGEISLDLMRIVSSVKVYSASAADENGNPKQECIGQANDVPLTLSDITNDGTGKLSAKKSFTRTAAGDVQMFVAVYSSNGNLKTVSASPKVTFAAGETKTLTAAVTNKAFDPWAGDTLKLFIWDANTLAPLDGENSSSTIYDPNEVVVIVSNPETGVNYSSFDVYVKGTRNSSNMYTMYRFNYKYADFVADAGANTGSNSSLYRIKEAYKAQRLDDFTFVKGTQVLQGGEIEMAIKAYKAAPEDTTKTTPDYIGGYHGDENLYDVFLKIDGVNIPLNKAGNYTGNTVQFCQKSYVDRCNIKDSKLIDHTKDYIITKDGIDLHQIAKWNDDAQIYEACMPMFTIMRQPKEDSERITDCMDFFWSDGTKAATYDVSNYGTTKYINTIEGTDQVAGATIPFPIVPEKFITKEDGTYINKVHLWSNAGDVDAYVWTNTVQGLHNTSATLNMRSAGDNKIYFYGHEREYVEAGDIWEVNTHYDIKINN